MKNYRSKEMKNMLFVYFLLFLLWCTNIYKQFPEVPVNNFKNIISVMEGVTISGVLSLITFFSDSLISSNLKDKLIGLFFIPRSGQTIFTRISNKTVKDDRFLIVEAISCYSDIIENRPMQKKEKRIYENTNWYKIYSKYKKDGAIIQAQADYLLCRDLYIETLEFLVLYLSALFLFKGTVLFSWHFILTLLVIAIIANISTHIKMNRFVNTVIAIDVSKIKN